MQFVTLQAIISVQYTVYEDVISALKSLVEPVIYCKHIMD